MTTEIDQSLRDHAAPNTTFKKALNQGTVTAPETTVERVGISTKQIDYRFHQEKSDRQPTNVAKQLVERVDYLLEPLAIIENDPEDAEIQIRSSQPTTRDGAHHYYEMMVKPQGVSIHRYRAPAGQPRQSEEMQLTRESFQRLCEDLDHAAE